MPRALQRGDDVQDHFNLDFLSWPVIGISIVTWPWLDDLWRYIPGPTTFYMLVSAGFMIFQMCDKLGLLERIKRRTTRK